MAKHRSFMLEKFIKAVDSGLLKAYFSKCHIAVPDNIILNEDNIHELLDGIGRESK